MKNLNEYTEYMLDSSKEDWKTAEVLFNKKRYNFCLFLCHLAIEKLLKAIIAKETKDTAPHTHNLIKLAEYGKLKIDEDRKLDLIEITTFNLSARYEDEKQEFYKKCTKIFTEKYFNSSKNIRNWLRKEYQKK